MTCDATLARCRCCLDEGHDPPHVCEMPDPQCGGSWADDDDPEMVRVYHYPGIREGGPSFGDEEAVDPAPGEYLVEPRPPEMIYIPGLGLMPKHFRARGGIKMYPAPTIGDMNA